MSDLKKQRRPGFEDILAASRRIHGHVTNTRIASSQELNKRLSCDAVYKCENLQETGAFKMRGASNAVLCLREQGISRDVATHSSGNHGAALARAAQRDGRKAVIVMPENSVAEKIASVKSYGADIVFCKPNHLAREAGLAELVARGFIPVPPYDHTDIISGQGTAALELLESQDDLDLLITPVGGGGLISGSAIIARHLNPTITILAAEPLGAADTAASFQQGKRVTSWQPDTVADGLRALIGEITFPIIHDLVDKVLTVSEAGIIRGMELVWEHMNMIIEPSSATVIAAMLEHPTAFSGKKSGVILSGGNIDHQLFPQFSNTTND
jgi:threonine dehydratase